MGIDQPKLAVVLAGSIVVLLQTLLCHKEDGWDFYWVWALVVSGVSALACLPGFALAISRKAPTSKDEKGVSRLVVPAMFLAGLWTAGALPTTVVRPFAEAGNGYFGTWAAVIAAWLMAFKDHSALREPLRKLTDTGDNYVALLLLASFTASLQTLWSCSTISGFCNPNAAWVLICSLLSMAVCVALCFSRVAEKMQPHIKVIALGFLVWWAAGAVVTTFEDPYGISFANGYFSCLAAFVASVRLVEKSWGIMVPESLFARASEALGGVPPEVLVILLASCVTLVAAAVRCAEDTCNRSEIWGIICSAVSLVVCFGVVWHTVNGGWLTEGAKVGGICLALLVWWTIGIGPMTFGSPFHLMGNGYFGCWVAFSAACLLAAKRVPQMQPILQAAGSGRELPAVLLASVVLLVQAFWDLTALGSSGSRILAVICALGSIIACVVMKVAPHLTEPRMKWVVMGLFIKWTVGTLFLTFRSTYCHTGNGYFACWSAWSFCGWLCIKHFPELSGYIVLDNADNAGAPKQPSNPDLEAPTSSAALDKGVLDEKEVIFEIGEGYREEVAAPVVEESSNAAPPIFAAPAPVATVAAEEQQPAAAVFGASFDAGPGDRVDTAM